MENCDRSEGVQSGSATSQADPRIPRRRGSAATSGPVQMLQYMLAAELIQRACAEVNSGAKLRTPMSLDLLQSSSSGRCAEMPAVIGSEDEIVVRVTDDRTQLLTGASKVRLLLEAGVSEAMVVVVEMDEDAATAYLRYSKLQSMFSR
jgi:hypothetical protein